MYNDSQSTHVCQMVKTVVRWCYSTWGMLLPFRETSLHTGQRGEHSKYATNNTCGN